MDYTNEFPNNVNFTIGQSNPATDWNFVMPYDKSVQNTSPKWTVNFNLPVAPVAGTNASVYVALSAGFSSALILNVNDSNITVPTTGLTYSDPSDAMIRKGIHGAFSDLRYTFPAGLLKAGDNHISFTLRTTGGSTAGDVMFDYLRLEANVPSCTTPVFTPAPDNIKTTTRANGCDTVVNYTVAASGYPAPSVTYTFTGATTGSGTGTGSGSAFSRGITTVTVAAANSCDTTRISFNVTVTDSLAPVLAAPADQFFCYAGSNYQVPVLTASDNCSIATVSFSITGATTRTGTGPDAGGAFNVGLSTITWAVTDSAGNISTASTRVTVHAPFTAGIPDVYAINPAATDKNTIYTGYAPAASLTLQATPTGPYTYLWNTGQTTPSVNVSTAGTYSVAVTDTNGCTSPASIVINNINVACGKNNDKVIVCLHGIPLCIPSVAVQALLNLGGKLGPCTPCANMKDCCPFCNTPEVSVHPNPTSGQLTVELDNYTASKATVQILNLAGHIIAQKDVVIMGAAQIVDFNIGSSPQGIYFVKVISTQGIQTAIVVLLK